VGATSQNSRKSPEIYPCAVIRPAVSRDLFRVRAMFRLMYGREAARCGWRDLGDAGDGSDDGGGLADDVPGESTTHCHR
jgi:hypothetical protein